MLNNIARIQRALTQAHLDAILLTDENDRRFATGFPSSAARSRQRAMPSSQPMSSSSA